MALAYSGAGQLGFVDFDDFGYVVENPFVARGLSWEGLRWALTTQHLGYWAPLTWLSHMLDVQLFGMDPAAQHWVNVLLHAVNAGLLYAVLRQLTGAVLPSAAVAALFAVHPLNVEAVAWVAERKTLLGTGFFLLALGAHGRFVRRGQRRFQAATALFMLLGLLCKASVVVLPFVLLLLDLWPLGRLAGGQGERARRPWELLREKLPLLLLAAASSAMTFRAQASAGAVASLHALSLGDRGANALVSVLRYLGKLLWPTHLAALYPWPEIIGARGWSDLQVAAAAAGLAALSLGALASARRLPALAVGWLWFLGGLLPVIGLVQVGDQAMADRHTYLPMIGVWIALVWTGFEWAAPRRAWRRAWMAVLGLAVAAFLGVTRQQVPVWRDTLSLFEHTLAVTRDNWIALNNVAWLRAVCPDARVRDGQRALELAREAVRLTRHRDAQMLDTLAVCYAERGRFRQALAVEQRAIRIAEARGRPAEAEALRRRRRQLARREPIRSERGCPGQHWPAAGGSRRGSPASVGTRPHAGS